jgi:hypothetical protein
MTKFKDRFKRYLFPARNLWAFNRLGKTAQRFEGMMGDGITFLGLPDTGSQRNIMTPDFALQNGLSIRSENENRGWVKFPNGCDEGIIGQVHTTIVLPDKTVVPVVFEVLPSCKLPVVLGVDFVLDNDIYNNFPGAIRDIDVVQEGNEMLGMGYKPRYAKVGDTVLRKVGLRAQSTDQQVETHTVNEDAELTRQLEWNGRYGSGASASVKEWIAEDTRRREHERLKYPNAELNPDTFLIRYDPKGLALAPDSHPSIPGRADTESPSVSDSSQSPADPEGMVGQDSRQPVDVPTTNLTRMPSFGRSEAAQL